MLMRKIRINSPVKWDPPRVGGALMLNTDGACGGALGNCSPGLELATSNNINPIEIGVDALGLTRMFQNPCRQLFHSTSIGEGSKTW